MGGGGGGGGGEIITCKLITGVECTELNSGKKPKVIDFMCNVQ